MKEQLNSAPRVALGEEALVESRRVALQSGADVDEGDGQQVVRSLDNGWVQCCLSTYRFTDGWIRLIWIRDVLTPFCFGSRWPQ